MLGFIFQKIRADNYEIISFFLKKMKEEKSKVIIEIIKSDQERWVDFVEDVLNFQPSENENKDNDLSKEKIKKD